ncbi:MAG: thioesterase [Rhodobiaceae bacterium]|nr:MAG: thioesterase [Rhodobiaceae bacterium]
MSAPQDEIALWQERIDVSPFQRWLGLQVADVGDGKICVTMPWKDEFISNPTPPTMHGGILASLIDLMGLYCVLTTGSLSLATVDLRVDYHRPAGPGTLRAEADIIKLGSKVSTAETKIFGENGKLLASGRGVYLMAG